jgi:hypothetical protein
MAQVGEHLPRKQEILHSNDSSITKTKRERKKREILQSN